MSSKRNLITSPLALSDLCWLEDLEVREWARQNSKHAQWPDLPLGSFARLQTAETLDQLRERLKSLVEEVNEIGRGISRAEASLSPIRALPYELLSQVFCYLGPFHFPRLSEVSMLHSVMSVSKLWRETALDTPALWTNFDLGDELWSPFSGVRQVLQQALGRDITPALDQWLHRSKTYALHLHIHGRGVTTDGAVKFLSHPTFIVRTPKLVDSIMLTNNELHGQAGMHLKVKASYLVHRFSASLKEFVCYDDDDVLQSFLDEEYPKLVVLRLFRTQVGSYTKFKAPLLKTLEICLRQHHRSPNAIKAIPEKYPFLTHLSILPDRYAKDPYPYPCFGKPLFPLISSALKLLPLLTRLVISGEFLVYLDCGSPPQCAALEELILLESRTGRRVEYGRDDVEGFFLGLPALRLLVLPLSREGIRLVSLPLAHTGYHYASEMALAFSESLLAADGISQCVRKSRLEVLRYDVKDCSKEVHDAVHKLLKEQSSSGSLGISSGPVVEFRKQDAHPLDSGNSVRILWWQLNAFIHYYHEGWNGLGGLFLPFSSAGAE
jgi:hypothetical protein